jgi:hypothetical protein
MVNGSSRAAGLDGEQCSVDGTKSVTLASELRGEATVGRL